MTFLPNIFVAIALWLTSFAVLLDNGDGNGGCHNEKSSSFFKNFCDWSSEYSLSNYNDTLLICNESTPNLKSYSGQMLGRNFFLLGNSVTRHYSFNIKYLLDEKLGNFSVKLSRQEEKQRCRTMLGTNSCKHIVSGSSTNIEFMWMNVIGEKSDFADKNDICYGVETTEKCLQEKFKHANITDVLIISSPIVNSSHSDSRYGFTKRLYENIRSSQNSFESAELSAHRILDILIRVFPGAIVWLPYPHIGYPEYNATISEMIENSNAFVKLTIESYCSERIRFFNTYPLLRSSLHLYSDSIHHPGLLSDMVVLAIFSALKPL